MSKSWIKPDPDKDSLQVCPEARESFLLIEDDDDEIPLARIKSELQSQDEKDPLGVNCGPASTDFFKALMIDEEEEPISYQLPGPHKVCSSCGQSWQSTGELNQHNCQLIDANRFKCKLCPKDFQYKRELKKHQKWHREKAIFKDLFCSKCGRCFESAGGLKKHKCCSCKLCAKDFPYNLELKDHQKYHLAETLIKDLSCSKCGVTCQNVSSLMVHMRRHTNEKPFKCQQCTISFTYQQDLIKHLRIHTSQTMFPCGICGEIFGPERELIEHIRMYHTVLRGSFRCPHCPRSFARYDGLRAHLRLHNGDSFLHEDPSSNTTSHKGHDRPYKM